MVDIEGEFLIPILFLPPQNTESARDSPQRPQNALYRLTTSDGAAHAAFHVSSVHRTDVDPGVVEGLDSPLPGVDLSLVQSPGARFIS